MKLKSSIEYNTLKDNKKPSEKTFLWILSSVTLFALFSIVIIGFHIHLSCDKHFQKLLKKKDHSRAKLYSWFQYNYEGSSPKIDFVPIQNSTFDNVNITKKIVCYYNVPSSTKPDLKPSEIHADLCTHINIAFAVVRDKKICGGERLFQTVKDVVGLKSINKQLKVLLSIGGAGEDKGFSEMVVDHASRKIFIRSIKQVLKEHNLDGVDLDWEFPAIQHGGFENRRERQHFSQLLREIRSEYIREKQDYLLTIAAAAPQIIADIAYDVDQINMYVDFVNIMTYDFHFYSSYTPFTGLNSPLYQRPEEKFYLSTLNINYTTNMYLSKGLVKEKIVVGVPTYGHTFRLVNVDNGVIGSPAAGYGSSGSLGFINYPEICVMFENSNMSIDTKIVFDKYARAPYLQKGREWISFDDRQSVIEKANFIKDNNYGGAMIYSLNADDFSGTCLFKGVHIKFPLSQSLKKILHS